MVITFCGHSQYNKTNEDEKRLLKILKDTINCRSVEFFLGGYGSFDSFAFECCKKYKDDNNKAELLFVTPYLTANGQRDRLKLIDKEYDGIIYPEIENKPPKYAIIYRNQWMIEKADYVICYVDHPWGGAYTSYKYAKKKNKQIINLGTLQG